MVWKRGHGAGAADVADAAVGLGDIELLSLLESGGRGFLLLIRLKITDFLVWTACMRRAPYGTLNLLWPNQCCK